MTTGLDGTPMPSFADSMTEDERWAISYYVLSFSAFNDPLTGEKLKLDAGHPGAAEQGRGAGVTGAPGGPRSRRRRRPGRAEGAGPLPPRAPERGASACRS